MNAVSGHFHWPASGFGRAFEAEVDSTAPHPPVITEWCAAADTYPWRSYKGRAILRKEAKSSAHSLRSSRGELGRQLEYMSHQRVIHSWQFESNTIRKRHRDQSRIPGSEGHAGHHRKKGRGPRPVRLPRRDPRARIRVRCRIQPQLLPPHIKSRLRDLLRSAELDHRQTARITTAKPLTPLSP